MNYENLNPTNNNLSHILPEVCRRNKDQKLQNSSKTSRMINKEILKKRSSAERITFMNSSLSIP